MYSLPYWKPALRLSLFLAIAIAINATIPISSIADWPQFRGENSAGIGTGSPPVEFGPGQNELWHVQLAPGHSSPCIAGDSIFATAYDEKSKQLLVVCLDRANGSTRWQKEIPVDQFEEGHPSFNPASSSPATDGQRVVVYFGSYGLICFDMNGEQLWDIKMPLAKSFAGNATSPVIVDGQVVLYRGNYVDHFLLSVDKHSGQELWRVPQNEKFTGEMACTACPIVSGDKVIIHSARSVQAFNIKTGERIWFTKCATTATTTPVLAGAEVIVAAWNKMGEPELRPVFPSFEKLIAEHDQNADGFIGPDELPRLWIFHRPDGNEAPMNGATLGFESVDKNKDRLLSEVEWVEQIENIEKYRAQYETHGMLAIPIDSQGIIDSKSIRVLETQAIPEVPSPLCDGNYIYFVKNGGVLTCLDLATGKRLYRERTGGKGTHYASPLLADGKIYTFAGDGRISVMMAGANPKLLAVNEMHDRVYATPAIVDGTIYVRTESAMYAFGQP